MRRFLQRWRQPQIRNVIKQNAFHSKQDSLAYEGPHNSL